MNMPFPSREQVESIRKNYPPDTRIVLNNMGICSCPDCSGRPLRPFPTTMRALEKRRWPSAP